MKNNITKFYDNYTEKLLLDYLRGNKRTESAIKYVLSKLDYSDKNILDIGYGIGYSSHEIAKYLPNAKIEAIDLNQELLKIGEVLFKEKNIIFEQKDITEDFSKEDKKYDVLVMLDVYEHIPKEKRKVFHDSINKIISDNGKVILTCPTIRHQRWLKENKPNGLQPVDEDVELKDIELFAKEISAKVSDFEEKNIWRENDYFYTTITKKESSAIKEISIDSQKERFDRIKNSEFSYLLKKVKKPFFVRAKEKIKRIVKI